MIGQNQIDAKLEGSPPNIFLQMQKAIRERHSVTSQAKKSLNSYSESKNWTVQVSFSLGPFYTVVFIVKYKVKN